MNNRRFEDNVNTGNNTGEDSKFNISIGDTQPPLKGKWGSTVWTDSQSAMMSHGASESGEESKSGSEYKGSEVEESDGAEYRMESENDGLGHKKMVRKGYQTVPAEDMLSDEYYEQVGDGHREYLNHPSGMNPPSAYKFKQSSQLAASSSVSRKPRGLKANKYSDEDAGFEEDDDEEDEDDPDDADFDPDYGAGSGHAIKNRDEDCDVEESDEENVGDDDLDASDDDVDVYLNKNSGRESGKNGRSLNSSREFKPIELSTRRKKDRTFFERDEETSAEESENCSDEDFRSTRRGGPVRKKNGGQYTFVNVSSRKNELRTSGRSVRKVSYVESDESEDIDECKKGNQKGEIEDEDGDAIEKILWHQPRGTAAEALKNNKSTDPVLLSYLFDSEINWNDVEFLIKWKGQSHLHCQWKSFTELQHLNGFKKVLNYTKKVAEDVKYRKMVSREEIEVNDVSKEMDLDIIKQNSQVERVIAGRLAKDSLDDVVPEYLVKWQGLSYAEATWEKDIDISFAQDAIDEFKAREAAAMVQGKSVDFQRKSSKGSLRKLDEQPAWLKGGNLRDYQLEGLNFLVNSWRNDTNVILADEMGLGKTVQSVSMLGFLLNAQQIQGPFLVVVPLSTLSNWAKEFRKWLPDMNVIIYIGTRASRELCQQYEFYNDKKAGRNIKFDALLTTYEVVLKDKAVLSKIRWNYLMVDEAHRLKNNEAALYMALSEFSTKNKLLITGTPLQNSVEELW